MKILFDIDKEKIREVCINTEKFLIENNISKLYVDDTIIAIDEVLTNIYEHGYNNVKGKKQYPVTLEIFLGFCRIYVIITDTGRYFSIQNQNIDKKDIKDYIKNNDIGGFGISLIKKMMNIVTQLHLFGENVLIMTKELQKEESILSPRSQELIGNL